MGAIITTGGKGIAINRTFLATPTKLAPTQFKVGTGTTAPTLSDTDLETPVLIGATNEKDFVSGFPTIDTVNNQATTRMFLNTLEANGNALTEFGTFNEDGTPIMFGRTTHSAITKSNTVEVSYIQKDKVL